MERIRQADGRVHGVIVACRRADGRWLLIRRSEHVAAPGKVCFPGGAIEPGEPQEQAVAREFLEELGVPVTPLCRVWHHADPDRPLTLWGWYAQLAAVALNPDPHEVAEILWMTRAQIASHPDTMPGTTNFLDHVLPHTDPAHDTPVPIDR